MTTTQRKAPRRDGTGHGAGVGQDCRKTTTTSEPLQAPLDYYPHAKAARPTNEATLADLLAAIRGDEFAEPVARIRKLVEAGDQGTADQLKKQLPAVSLSGAIKGRRKKAAEEGRFDHSGLLQIDLDGKDNPDRTVEEMRETLIDDDHIIAVFTSASGLGVKGVAVMLPSVDQHRACFAAAEDHFAARGLKIDPACKDPVRLCFVSHDPDAYIRETEARPFLPQPAAPAADLHETSVIDPDDENVEPIFRTGAGGGIVIRGRRPLDASTIREMLSHIPYPGFDDWLKISNAVWKELGVAEGTSILQEWAPEKSPGDYEKHSKYPLEEVTAGTLYFHAQANGWNPHHVAKAAEAAMKEERRPPFHYDGTKYFLDHGGDYIPLDCRSVSRHLLARRVEKTEIAGILCEIQTRGFIHYAGPLAGHSRGVHELGGKRLLATSSPNLILPGPGDWGTIYELLQGMLGPEGEAHRTDQIEAVLGFWKYGLETLRGRKFRPCWALALAGPRGCGKSLLIDLTEALLGGRRANPYAYFTGRTHFNADLAGAELLAVDDEVGSFDIRTRKHLAAAIKNNLFAGSVRIEGKHRTAFNFRPVWRMMLAVNDEPEALLALPPMTEDIGDKIALLRCHKSPLPMPAYTSDEKERFFSQLVSELPALAAELEKMEFPPESLDERCGIRAFHHPDLLDAMGALSPEQSLLDLIDAAADAGGIALPWLGTAAALRSLLAECKDTSKAAADLLDHWAPACGAYLGKLEKAGKRVEKSTTVRGLQRWHIEAP